LVNEYGRFTHTRKVSPGQWYQYFKKKIKIPKVDEVREALPAVQKIPNWFQQLMVFVLRDVKSKIFEPAVHDPEHHSYAPVGVVHWLFCAVL